MLAPAIHRPWPRLRSGDLTPIWVPDEVEAPARALTQVAQADEAGPRSSRATCVEVDPIEMMRRTRPRLLGLDVHRDTIAVALGEETGQPISYCTFVNDAGAVRKLNQRGRPAVIAVDQPHP